jgi:hypothetical protein
VAAVAALLMAQESGESTVEIVVQPGIESIGVAGAQQTGAGDGMGGAAVGHLEQSGAAFAYVGAGVVVAVVDQERALLLAQRQRTAGGHGGFLLFGSFTPFIRPLPILSIKIH